MKKKKKIDIIASQAKGIPDMAKKGVIKIGGKSKKRKRMLRGGKKKNKLSMVQFLFVCLSINVFNSPVHNS